MPIGRSIQGRSIVGRSVRGRSIAGFSDAIRNLLTSGTFTRASVANYWNSSGTLTEAAVNELRFDYEPDGSAARGYLVEESRTNLLAHSEFENGISDAKTSGGLVSAVTFAGLKSNTGVAFGHDGSTSSFAYLGGDYIGSEPYRFSVFVRMDDGLAPSFGSSSATNAANDFALVADNNPISDPTLYTVEDMGGGLYRVCGSVTAGGTTADRNTGVVKYNTNSSRTFSVSGFTLEHGTFVTSYIQTTTTAVTRASDVLTSPFSEAFGTLHLTGEHKGGDGVIWQADDGTENERIRLEVSSGNVVLVVTDGGVEQASITAGALDSTGDFDVAFRFDTNDIAISLDGAAAVTDTTATIPTVTTCRFGANTAGTVAINWYTKANYRSGLLTDSELQGLTA